MDRRHLPLAAVMTSAFAASPAIAAESESRSKLSFEIEAVSDYRYRGVSLSGGEPALQAEALLEFDSGFWASAWGSTLSGHEVELQFAAGYSADIYRQVNVEISVNYFAYPAAPSTNYLEGSAVLSRSFGSLTSKVGVEYAPRQSHLRDEGGTMQDNLYTYFALDLAVGKTPVTVGGQIGYETGLFDTRDSGGKWDWRIGAEAETKWVDVGVAYINSNGRLIDGRGRNLADETVVASLGKSF
jgi:uncharacterized protein (TIGR02001 family)